MVATWEGKRKKKEKVGLYPTGWESEGKTIKGTRQAHQISKRWWMWNPSRWGCELGIRRISPL